MDKPENLYEKYLPSPPDAPIVFMVIGVMLFKPLEHKTTLEIFYSIVVNTHEDRVSQITKVRKAVEAEGWTPLEIKTSIVDGDPTYREYYNGIKINDLFNTNKAN